MVQRPQRMLPRCRTASSNGGYRAGSTRSRRTRSAHLHGRRDGGAVPGSRRAGLRETRLRRAGVRARASRLRPRARPHLGPSWPLTREWLAAFRCHVIDEYRLLSRDPSRHGRGQLRRCESSLLPGLPCRLPAKGASGSIRLFWGRRIQRDKRSPGASAWLIPPRDVARGGGSFRNRIGCPTRSVAQCTSRPVGSGQ